MQKIDIGRSCRKYAVLLLIPVAILILLPLCRGTSSQNAHLTVRQALHKRASGQPGSLPPARSRTRLQKHGWRPPSASARRGIVAPGAASPASAAKNAICEVVAVGNMTRPMVITLPLFESAPMCGNHGWRMVAIPSVVARPRGGVFATATRFYQTKTRACNISVYTAPRPLASGAHVWTLLASETNRNASAASARR